MGQQIPDSSNTYLSKMSCVIFFSLLLPAKDLIRTAVGQTRLLMGERFKQFEGLVDNCEFKRGEKETTCTDLDGFWDMINFQVCSCMLM